MLTWDQSTGLWPIQDCCFDDDVLRKQWQLTLPVSDHKWVLHAHFHQGRQGPELWENLQLWWYSPARPLVFTQPPSSANSFNRPLFLWMPCRMCGLSGFHVYNLPAMDTDWPRAVCTGSFGKYSPWKVSASWHRNTWNASSATKSTSLGAMPCCSSWMSVTAVTSQLSWLTIKLPLCTVHNELQGNAAWHEDVECLHLHLHLTFLYK